MGSTIDSGSRLRLRDYANFRVFSSSSDEARARRPTDVVLLVFGVVGLGIMSQVSPDTAAVDGFTEWVRSLPGLFNWVWDLTDVKEGVHILTVNLSGFKDQIGIKSQKVIVKK